MKNQLSGLLLDFQKIFWYNIKKTIFTRTGFRGVPVAYRVQPTGVTWPWFSGKLQTLSTCIWAIWEFCMRSPGRKNGPLLPWPARFWELTL